MVLAREIAAWIESEGSFLSGFDLYIRSGGGVLERELRQYAQQAYITEEQWSTLVTALNEKLADAGYAETKSKPVRKEEEPDAVVALRRQLRILKKRESSLHGQMKALAFQPQPHVHKQELHALAKEMMYEVQPQLDDVWAQIKAWEDEGVLPVPGAQQIIDETVNKMRRHESMRQRMSQLKRMLAKDDLPADKRAKYETEQKDKAAAMAAIENELNL